MAVRQRKDGTTILMVFVGAISCGLLAGQQWASAATPRLTSIRCWPAQSCQSRTRVPVGGQLLLRGSAMPARPIVKLPGAMPLRGRRIDRSTVLVDVPRGTSRGNVKLRSPGGRWSNARGPITAIRPIAGAAIARATGTPFDGNGMWIWQLSATEGGNLERIIAKAQAADVTTVFVKSGDGGGPNRNWKQFSRTMIDRLHSGGLKVCAWPYVYGYSPRAEAQASIAAIRMGADCLAIDAEAEYEGRYGSAWTYISTVRQAVGIGFPISLAGFPYTDYHPSFPYSTFFGPGGAQYNQPQAYWRAIGTTVGRVLGRTWATNRPYGRRIMPIGQLWQGPKQDEVLAFRSTAAALGAPGLSWWDWQETPAKLWTTLGLPVPWPHPQVVEPDWIELRAGPGGRTGSRGDLVVWAQQYLQAGGARITADGEFGPTTRDAVVTFQRSRGLPTTGTIGTLTWKALLKIRRPLPAWATGAASSAGASRPPLPPASAIEKGRSEFRFATRGDRQAGSATASTRGSSEGR